MATVAKTLGFVIVRGLAVHVYAGVALHDRDWQAWLDAASESPPIGSLVFTPGSGPNVRQRARLMEVVDAKKAETNQTPPPVAVVTPGNPISLGIITALGWLGYGPMKAFKPEDWRAALRYLNVGHLEAAVRQATRQLSVELGVPDPLTPGGSASR